MDIVFYLKMIFKIGFKKKFFLKLQFLDFLRKIFCRVLLEKGKLFSIGHFKMGLLSWN